MHPPERDRGPAAGGPGRSGGDGVALEARDVVKRFGPVEALDGVSLAVRPGEVVALVGESGSGKTTLLRTFNRTVVPDGGEVFLAGRNIRSIDPIRLRRDTGFVQQEGGLLPHWNVLRNAAMVPRLRNPRDAADARRRARRALVRAGLPPEEYGGRWPRQLSGGQRQRVALARALAHEPAVILLDEPFGALDAITRGDLHETFTALIRDSGAAALLVTHDLHEAAVLADRVAVMRAGRIEQVATPAELRRSPATPYVARLLDRARLRDGVR